MNKIRIKISLYFLSLILMVILGSLFSFTLARLIGGIAINFAPASSYSLVERFICKDGGVVALELTKDDSRMPHQVVTCVSSDGIVSSPQTVRAQWMIYQTFFLIILIPTFIAGAILAAMSIFR